MTQLTIRKELEDKIIAFAASQVPPLKVAFEGVSFEKPNEPAFLEVYRIPHATRNNYIDGIHKTLYGMLHINVYTKDGNGTKLSETIAEKLISLFPVIPKTGTVSIEQTGSIQNPVTTAQWRVLPVRFNYRQED